MGLIKKEGGTVIWPLVRFSYNTQVSKPPSPFPSKPTWLLNAKDCAFAIKNNFAHCGDLEPNWLGTDDGGRDVLARLIYGFRISVLFGLALTIVSSVIGVAAGAVQGYFGGWIDLLFQRLIEIWTSIPELYLLLIISSVLVPGFFVLLGILPVSYTHLNERVTIDGIGFAAIGRLKLLQLLQERVRAVGIEPQFGRAVASLNELADPDLIVGADGVNSLVRQTFADQFGASVTYGSNRFAWFGTATAYDTLTQTFRHTPIGDFNAHHYLSLIHI